MTKFFQRFEASSSPHPCMYYTQQGLEIKNNGGVWQKVNCSFYMDTQVSLNVAINLVSKSKTSNFEIEPLHEYRYIKGYSLSNTL